MISMQAQKCKSFKIGTVGSAATNRPERMQAFSREKYRKFFSVFNDSKALH